ncbi:uncharacterized protein RHIMIDRAFT_137617 [Rhizopus microsporus ATCC 52813]|uniref:BZIP domain-containing protein n=1 Tax=Rhizopus microsporus ATCC 52813 TaxID=1340429 RepID=A0A2G4SVL5_RHIZD|nr:uncharacterized protein RHIMIDRAFT_137617 [Rhizopus microsporus ATCC 52813]PHZ12823.1 hypothetical protein RHIMIDRAFT_137617 [Rhizopus microsporus ATCC 52813]
MSDINNSNNSNNNTDLISEFLSLPVDFKVDPLVVPTTKSVVRLKKSRISLEDKDQKTKERILRNRAAAQESRDKKRRYVSELESSNKKLSEENEQLKKRIKTLEDQQALIACQFEALQKLNPFLFNDFCGSARIVKKEMVY